MLLLAATVAVHFLVNQFYDPRLEGASLVVWNIIDPFEAAGMVMILIVAFARKRRLDAGSDPSVSREYIETNVTLYYSAALFIVFLWNWLGVTVVDPGNAEWLVWMLIDATLPLLLVSTALRLLREAAAARSA